MITARANRPNIVKRKKIEATANNLSDTLNNRANKSNTPGNIINLRKTGI